LVFAHELALQKENNSPTIYPRSFNEFSSFLIHQQEHIKRKMGKTVTFKTRVDSAHQAGNNFSEKLKPILKVQSSTKEIMKISNRIAAKQQRIKRLMNKSISNRMKITQINEDSGSAKAVTAFAWVSVDQQKFCWKSSVLQRCCSFISLDDVISIYLGQPGGFTNSQTDSSFYGSLWRPIPDVAWLSFTMELPRGIYLVVQLQDEQQLINWFWGLCDIVQAPYILSKPTIQAEIRNLEWTHIEQKFAHTYKDEDSQEITGLCNLVDVLVKISVQFRNDTFV
jgi:hypothetical protein